MLSTLGVFEQQLSREPSVDMSEQPPTIDELWDSALIGKGFVDPRTGDPSHSALAYKIGVGPSTISNMRNGSVTPKPTTVAKVADALGIRVTELSRWIGQARALPEAYMPPVQADLLDERERKAVDELIRLLAAPKVARQEAVKAEAQTPASKGRRLAAVPDKIAASKRTKEAGDSTPGQ